MAYTPTLSQPYSAMLRRIAWAINKPMTQTLMAILNTLNLDAEKICENCRDMSQCGICILNGNNENTLLNNLLDPIKQVYTTEVKMKVNQVSVLVSKKLGKNYNSWGVSHSVTAELEEEQYPDAIRVLDSELKKLVADSLPTPEKEQSAQKKKSA